MTAPSSRGEAPPPVVLHRRWHPLAGAALVGLLSVVAAVLAVSGVGPLAVGVSAFLAMGAIAGFSLSGST